MASDIFSVEPPRWLQEISLGDVTKHERESYALGLQKRHLDIQQQHYANEEKLTGLRAQALMLQSEARISALQNANDAAAMRIQMQDAQLKLAQAKFEQASQATLMKETMTSDFQQKLSGIPDPELRTRIVSKNPNFIKEGVSTDQWADVKAFYTAKEIADAEAMKAQGLVPASVTVNPKGTATTYKPESEIGKGSVNAFTFLQSMRTKAEASGDKRTADELAGRIAKLSGTDTESHGKQIFQSILENKIKGIDRELLQPGNTLEAAKKNASALSRRKALLYDRMEAGNDLNALLSNPTIAPPSGSTATAPALAPGTAATPSATIPTPGSVVNGYRFKGGTVSDQNNWEPVNSD